MTMPTIGDLSEWIRNYGYDARHVAARLSSDGRAIFYCLYAEQNSSVVLELYVDGNSAVENFCNFTLSGYTVPVP
jgi:hypothetical protein